MKILEPKPPPTSGRDHAQLVLGREADEGRQHQPRDVRVLAGGVEREALLPAVVLADRRARLDGVGDQPVVDEVDLGDVLGAGEGRIDLGLVAQVPLIDRVVGRLGVDLRLAGVLRGGDIDRGRQHLVVDGDAARRRPWPAPASRRSRRPRGRRHSAPCPAPAPDARRPSSASRPWNGSSSRRSGRRPCRWRCRRRCRRRGSPATSAPPRRRCS